MNIDNEKLNIIKRVGAILIAIGLWFASITFSASGFDFTISGYLWIGYMLSFAVTYSQIIFNSQLQYKGKNYTIYVLGILGYLYGIGSNLVGLWIGQGNPSLSSMFNQPFAAIFMLVVAIFIEVFPETALVYGLRGITDDGDGDVIKNAVEIRSSRSRPEPEEMPHLPTMRRPIESEDMEKARRLGPMRRPRSA